MSSSNFFDKDLSADERDLYDRQFRLDGWNQKVIKNARVLIAGVGGLGCEIAKNLAMVGVGRLDMVDLDVIEHSNLNRQILFAGAKMGTPKAVVAAERLKDINPNIILKGYHTSLERLDPAIYANANVVVGALDSMGARFNLNTYCVAFKKPLVDGGVAGYHGHVYTIFPFENACFECYPPPAIESDEMAACTVVGVPRKRVHCLFKAEMAFKEKYNGDPDLKNLQHVQILMKAANDLATEHNFLPLFTQADVVKILDRHEPGVITINAVISSLQSHEVLKILHWQAGNKALGEPVRDYVVFNGMTMNVYHVEKKRNPNCRQCGSKARRVTITLKPTNKASEILYAIENYNYLRDPDMVPIITIMDFNQVREINTDLTIADNKLRNNEIITVAGFKDGEIQVILQLK